MDRNLVKIFFPNGFQFERIWLLAKIEFKLRYYENNLGLLWALLKPLMDIAIFYVVFQIILKQNVPNFASYLFIGFVIYNFFNESTSGTMMLLKTKKYLYEYSNMNKLEIYVSTIMSNVIGLFFNILMFFLFYFAVDGGLSSFGINVLLFIPVFISLFILSMGISLILSNIFIVAKDVNQVWAPLSTFLMFTSPIFYKLETLQEHAPFLNYINPISGIIINARKTLMYNELPDWGMLGYNFLYSLFFLLVGIMLLKNLGAKAAEKL